MNILYLHGYGSSGQSSTVEYLKKSLPDYYHIEAPDIPVDPAEALPFLKHLCDDEHFDIIIGTSMGAQYAQNHADLFLRKSAESAGKITPKGSSRHEGYR